jgi:hypothetical protein
MEARPGEGRGPHESVCEYGPAGAGPEMAYDPLAGIGHGAHYGDLLPSLVLKGDTLLEFQIAMLNNSCENFPVLARRALSRL